MAPQHEAEEVPAQVPTNKCKRGERSTNKAEGIYEVISLDPKDGAPLESPNINAKWENHCGKVVRDICKITWED